MIVDSAAEFLAERSSSEQVRKVSAVPGGWDTALWQGLAELGWCGIHSPDAQGGLGLGVVELALLQEQLGRRLACVPYFDSVALAASALRQLTGHGAADAALQALCSGEQRFALALPNPTTPQAIAATVQLQADGGWLLQGRWDQVGSAALAQQLLLPAQLSDGSWALFLVSADAPGLSISAKPAVDATRLHGRVAAQQVKLAATQCLTLGDSAASVLAQTRCIATIALAAEQVGVAQQALDLTLAYTLERQQFEKPIASFQGVKHRCAQMLVAVETARSAVYGAACLSDTAPGAASLVRAAAHAISEATEAALYCTREAIQLHGGVGFTWEYDPHLFLRRAQASSQRLGPLSWWREQVAQQLLDTEEAIA
ncbi:MAG: acyl-CoA/acyl-ACP dehydrogenase [Proteobacteria bacterium]|nr:acyl-CoA/acyl-ACP dehydrogenase [Pseudomonadota bacterium]MBS0493561.1 acyl-CoA/acyl-ACP dehydrogenase [Pseudomonadota bacterium]